jgi:hypothetical protein
MPFPKPLLRLIQQDVAAQGVRAAPMIPGRRDKQRSKIGRQRIATHSQKIPEIIIAQMMAKLIAPSGC